MTPLSSIATIDDLIVALLRLGYKKSYREWYLGEVEMYEEKNCRNVFSVTRYPQENQVHVFINHKNKPAENDIVFGDVVLGALVVAEFYPYIKEWYFAESFAGSHKSISWEDAENIYLEEIDKNLDLWVKSWEKEDARR